MTQKEICTWTNPSPWGSRWTYWMQPSGWRSHPGTEVHRASEPTGYDRRDAMAAKSLATRLDHTVDESNADSAWDYMTSAIASNKKPRRADCNREYPNGTDTAETQIIMKSNIENRAFGFPRSDTMYWNCLHKLS